MTMSFRVSVMFGTLALIASGGIAHAAKPVVPAVTASPTSSAAANSTTSTASAAQTQVLVPAGTLIVVSTKHGYTSYGASSGTKVLYEVAQDVVVNGYLIARAGDAAEGEILNSHQGVHNLIESQAANLRVSLDKIFTYCGDTLDMDFQRSEFRQRQGFLGSHKDVEIIKGQKYQAPTERAVRVCGTKTDEIQPAIPADALKGDQ